MNKQTTYALLMRSEEKGRDLMETAVYSICIASAVLAMWQFARQPVTLMSHRPTHSAAHVSQHEMRPIPHGKS
jgi:hypothetical protein